MNVALKKETVDDISLLKEITGKNDEEVVSDAMKTFIKKRALSIIGSVGITFFGLAFHIGHLISISNF